MSWGSTINGYCIIIKQQKWFEDKSLLDILSGVDGQEAISFENVIQENNYIFYF